MFVYAALLGHPFIDLQRGSSLIDDFCGISKWRCVMSGVLWHLGSLVL